MIYLHTFVKTLCLHIPGPIIECKGVRAIFQKKGKQKKKRRNTVSKRKIKKYYYTEPTKKITSTPQINIQIFEMKYIHPRDEILINSSLR